MKKVTKAVIPAAGLGTRVLPATKAMPKGMLPIVDKPAIQYLVEEAVRSGITDILIILGRNQSIIEDHFDRSPELEEKLAKPGKEKMLEECLGIANMLPRERPLHFQQVLYSARLLTVQMQPLSQAFFLLMYFQYRQEQLRFHHSSAPFRKSLLLKHHRLS